jgi:S-adenosyl methyltransferase
VLGAAGLMCAGSCLVLSQFASDSDPEAMAELRAVAACTAVETYFRPRSQNQRFSTDLSFLSPA